MFSQFIPGKMAWCYYSNWRLASMFSVSRVRVLTSMATPSLRDQSSECPDIRRRVLNHFQLDELNHNHHEHKWWWSWEGGKAHTHSSLHTFMYTLSFAWECPYCLFFTQPSKLLWKYQSIYYLLWPFLKYPERNNHTVHLFSNHLPPLSINNMHHIVLCFLWLWLLSQVNCKKLESIFFFSFVSAFLMSNTR